MTFFFFFFESDVVGCKNRMTPSVCLHPPTHTNTHAHTRTDHLKCVLGVVSFDYECYESAV